MNFIIVFIMFCRMDSTRSLEIWFHSDEEAEEMFVKLCNFKWNVNGRPARVVRVNSPESVGKCFSSALFFLPT